MSVSVLVPIPAVSLKCVNTSLILGLQRSLGSIAFKGRVASISNYNTTNAYKTKNHNHNIKRLLPVVANGLENTILNKNNSFLTCKRSFHSFNNRSLYSFNSGNPQSSLSLLNRKTFKYSYSTGKPPTNESNNDSVKKETNASANANANASANINASSSGSGANADANADGPVSHDVLAQKEQEANRNLNDANIQAEFYKKLLKSGYAQYVVSRYETPGIAQSPECMSLYMDALTRTGKHNQADAVRQVINTSSTANGVNNPTMNNSNGNGNGNGMNNTTNMNNANTSGMNPPMNANYPYMNPFFGTPKEPIHVVISESTATIVLRWIKWLIIFGLLTYGFSEGFKYLSENTSIFKNSEVSDKSVDVAKANIKFEDVCGVDEARHELEEIVDFLKDPTKYETLGGKLPKGVLLTGPPGTGKTLLARATAGEAGVDFFFMSGSEFDEVYVGVGAKRIRDLFKQARSRAPAIVFIDELDAIGGKRNPKDQAYAKQTLNQLLVELDGFEQTQGIIIIGATNFPESLDKALTRPGRFDKIVNVDLPDIRGRTEILKHHMKKVTLSKDVDPSVIARGTAGLSGAQLSSIVNQAAVYACQKNATAVDMSHLEWAKDKILLGAEKKSMVLPEVTRKATAYHEAGHAIMALFTPQTTPLYKATILPRGRALGVTFQLPTNDKYDITKSECLARLDVCMGGKVAEEFIYGKENTTSGCGSDLRQATKIARAVVTSYGMNEKIGPVELSEDWNLWSGKIKDLADQEVIGLLKNSEDRARQLLKEKEVEFRRLAEGLIEYETLNRQEIDKVVKGEALDRPKYATNKVVETPDNDGRKGIDKGSLGAVI